MDLPNDEQLTWDAEEAPNLTVGDLRALLAALQSRLKGDGEGWRSIETAPKDGSGVLVICMGAERPAAGAAWFIDGVWTSLDPDGAEDFGKDFFHASVWHKPTHWRPFPSPPPDGVSRDE